MDPIINNSSDTFLNAITTPPEKKEENISRIPKKENIDTFESPFKSPETMRAIVNTAVVTPAVAIGLIPLWMGNPQQKPTITPTAPTPPAPPTNK